MAAPRFESQVALDVCVCAASAAPDRADAHGVVKLSRRDHKMLWQTSYRYYPLWFGAST